jgi:hypothetical protein
MLPKFNSALSCCLRWPHYSDYTRGPEAFLTTFFFLFCLLNLLWIILCQTSVIGTVYKNTGILKSSQWISFPEKKRKNKQTNKLVVYKNIPTLVPSTYPTVNRPGQSTPYVVCKSAAATGSWGVTGNSETCIDKKHKLIPNAECICLKICLHFLWWYTYICTLKTFFFHLTPLDCHSKPHMINHQLSKLLSIKVILLA